MTPSMGSRYWNVAHACSEDTCGFDPPIYRRLDEKESWMIWLLIAECVSKGTVESVEIIIRHTLCQKKGVIVLYYFYDIPLHTTKHLHSTTIVLNHVRSWPVYVLEWIVQEVSLQGKMLLFFSWKNLIIIAAWEHISPAPPRFHISGCNNY